MAGILFVIFCILAAPVIAAGVSRCPKCHGYCVDEWECAENQFRQQSEESDE